MLPSRRSPPPVGIMTKQSRPDMEALMHCFWFSRKVALPKKSLLARVMSAAQGKLPAQRASEVPSTRLHAPACLLHLSSCSAAGARCCEAAFSPCHYLTCLE